MKQKIENGVCWYFGFCNYREKSFKTKNHNEISQFATEQGSICTQIQRDLRSADSIVRNEEMSGIFSSNSK